MRKSNAKVDVIYVDELGEAARTPDGTGFIYYDTEEEAVADSLVENPQVVYIDALREEWEEDDLDREFDELCDWIDEYRDEMRYR